ncbi:transporter [Bremerella sp. JC770]|uniref:transporter n=1 Tax=Bremerella sp. JC770 TaxID=3232137 RepID=UPI0034581B92
MTRPSDIRPRKKTAAQCLGSAVTCLFAAVGSLSQVNLVHADEPGQEQFRLDQPIYVAQAAERTSKPIFTEDNQPHFRIDKPIYFAERGNDRPLFPSDHQPSLGRNQQRHVTEPVANTTQPAVNNPSVSPTPMYRSASVEQEVNSGSPEPYHPQFRIDHPVYTAHVDRTSGPSGSFSQNPQPSIQKIEPAGIRSASESLNSKPAESGFHPASVATLAEGSQLPASIPATPVMNQLNASRVDLSDTRNYPSTAADQGRLQPQRQAEQPLVADLKADRSPTPDWEQQLRQIYGDNTPLFVGYALNNETFRESVVSQTSLQEADPMIPAVPELPQGSSAATSPQSESETYGEEPQDFNIQFLRTASVLLQQGDWQFDYGIAYAKDDYDFPIALNPSGVARANIKRRSIQMPLAVRYGLTDRLQFSAALPVGWSNAEFSSLGLFDESDSQVGIGDLELGLNYHWKYGQFQCTPDVILSFGLTLPTGDGQFPTTGISQAALANDVWAPSTQLLFINRYDPIVCFYGVGYRYQFEREFDGVDVQYGHQFSYNFGVGFAVNDRVTVSTAFLGLFQTETEINGVGLPGSIYEPLRLRFAVTSYRCGRIVEPFAEIGMTNDAADAIIGINWTL